MKMKSITLETISNQLQATKQELDERLGKIAISQDKLLKKFETWEQENAVGTHQISTLRKDVDDHEKRITSLESAKN